MAIYTQNQLDRLADKVRGGGALGKEDVLNLIRDCAKLRVELIDARESLLELAATMAETKSVVSTHSGICPLCGDSAETLQGGPVD